MTKLVKADRLAAALGMKTLWVKDDSGNPTHSFKDRVVSVATTMARAFGFQAISCASTGNLANSVAAQVPAAPTSAARTARCVAANAGATASSTISRTVFLGSSCGSTRRPGRPRRPLRSYKLVRGQFREARICKCESREPRRPELVRRRSRCLGR